MNLKYIAFDTETEEISYQNPVPDMMCLTFAEDASLKGSIITPWEVDIEGMAKNKILTGHSVGHNMSFDLSILAFMYPALMPDIFASLDKDLVHDTMIREILLNITRHGSIEFIELNGANMRCDYSLAGLERKYLNIDRSDLKKDKDAPRLHYNIYRDVPVAQWDENFIDYAVDDAINTGLIYQCQETEREACIDEIGKDPFITETFNVRKAFALRLLECVGTRLDPDMVRKVADEFETEYHSDRLVAPLTAAGFRTPPIPPMPYAKGTVDHQEDCRGHKDHVDYIKSSKITDCGCPLKMKKAEPEHSPKRPRHQYIWNLAATTDNIEAWPADATSSELRKEKVYKDIVSGKAVRKEVILCTGIQSALGDCLKTIQTHVRAETKVPKKLNDTKAFIELCIKAGHKYFLPEDIKLSTAKEWSETFTDRDDLLSIWYERERLKKIVNEYLPKMYYTDKDGNTEPATILRASYGPLVLTGRSHSWASKMYPSRSDQTVDPRVRPCTIPRDGNVIVSTDYRGMELGTLAQKCMDLFGYSELANKINAGIDTHAYLAAQIANQLDNEFSGICGSAGKSSKDAIFEVFSACKDLGEECGSKPFQKIYKADVIRRTQKELDRPVLWKDFFKHYRTMAKPFGLGKPGMLGSATICSVAKATYGIIISKNIADDIGAIWLDTYPEMREYLNYIKKSCKDPNHSPIMEEDEDGKPKKRTYYAYDTPRGMHRSKCGICEAANGTALQAPSAEGALDALYEVQKACWLAKEGDPIYGYMPIMFVHDEIIGESPEDDKIGIRVREVEKIMVDRMELATKDVKAGTESAAMRRWAKKAESIWDESGNLIAWEA